MALTELQEEQASWAYDGIKPIVYWADSDLVLDSVNFQSSEARAMFIVCGNQVVCLDGEC